jgi:hypothetical protein
MRIPDRHVGVVVACAVGHYRQRRKSIERTTMSNRTAAEWQRHTGVHFQIEAKINTTDFREQGRRHVRMVDGGIQLHDVVLLVGIGVDQHVVQERAPDFLCVSQSGVEVGLLGLQVDGGLLRTDERDGHLHFHLRHARWELHKACNNSTAAA